MFNVIILNRWKKVKKKLATSQTGEEKKYIIDDDDLLIRISYFYTWKKTMIRYLFNFVINFIDHELHPPFSPNTSFKLSNSKSFTHKCLKFYYFSLFLYKFLNKVFSFLFDLIHYFVFCFYLFWLLSKSFCRMLYKSYLPKN